MIFRPASFAVRRISKVSVLDPANQFRRRRMGRNFNPWPGEIRAPNFAVRRVSFRPRNKWGWGCREILINGRVQIIGDELLWNIVIFVLKCMYGFRTKIILCCPKLGITVQNQAITRTKRHTRSYVILGGGSINNFSIFCNRLQFITTPPPFHGISRIFQPPLIITVPFPPIIQIFIVSSVWTPLMVYR